MPKLVVPLSDTKIRHAAPREKPYTLTDGGGLYIEINPTGSKIWRLKYRQPNGKWNHLTFGPYPAVSLQMAREKRAATQRARAEGNDPALTKRVERSRKQADEDPSLTFESIAREWLNHQESAWAKGTLRPALSRLERDIFPHIGKLRITEVKTPVLLEALRKVESRGALETAKRIAQHCGRIFDYAIATGRAESNPVPGLRSSLKRFGRTHHAAIKPDELPEFLRVLHRFEPRMFMQTRIMIRLMLLVFVRTSELTETPWSEIDFQNERWIISWKRMKMGRRKVNPRQVDHHVHLPRQGWELLRELHTLTGTSRFLFPSRRDGDTTTSNWAILAALKRMGYSGRMTGHGFRSLAMGVIKEKLGYRHEVVDRQLAHLSADVYGEAYDRAEFHEQRRKMMQDYADYIDRVQAEALGITWAGSKTS